MDPQIFGFVFEASTNCEQGTSYVEKAASYQQLKPDLLDAAIVQPASFQPLDDLVYRHCRVGLQQGQDPLFVRREPFVRK
jgi:hypothetical protein